MTVNDPVKLVMLCVGMVGGFVMWAIGEAGGEILVSSIVGYLLGNGNLARMRQPPGPVLVPKLFPNPASADRRDPNRTRFDDRN